jgi:diacylglycerol O-acyltransferase / wax synthase
MRQLSDQDAVFLYSETAHSNSNVTLLHIYDQTTAPGGKVRFKSILAHIDNRLERVPVLRQRVRKIPFGLGRPYWVEDENFDLEYHVRHIALPKPGDWRQFCIQASRIHARPLDLNRPLWEIYVIEGLDSFLDLPQGSFALLLKIHHAAIDLEHGNEITAMLHDLSPQSPAHEPPEPWFPAAPPGDLALLARSLTHSVLFPLQRLRRMTRAVASVAPAVVNRFVEVLTHPEQVVVTRFNTVVSPHRVFDTRRIPLGEFEAVRGLVDGTTVNDAVLAVCGGGLRRYLELQGELPECSLNASAPLGVRADGSNELNWARVRLGTDIADPVARLAMIRAQTAAAAGMTNAVSARGLTDMARFAPGATIAMASKMLAYASAQLGRWAPLANCTIANVPGPAAPLYLKGARMSYFSAIMPISDGMGLVFSVTSYDDKIIVSFTSCYEQLPDPEVFAQCVRDSFQEYLAVAAGRKRSSPAGARCASPRRPSRRRKLAPLAV